MIGGMLWILRKWRELRDSWRLLTPEEIEKGPYRLWVQHRDGRMILKGASLRLKELNEIWDGLLPDEEIVRFVMQEDTAPPLPPPQPTLTPDDTSDILAQ